MDQTSFTSIKYEYRSYLQHDVTERVQKTVNKNYGSFDLFRAVQYTQFASVRINPRIRVFATPDIWRDKIEQRSGTFA